MTKAKTISLILLFFAGIFLSSGQKGTYATSSSSAEVSVSIGEYQFFLFGYTSPRALVTLEGVGVFDQTYANDKGYFEFFNRFSPFSTREPCLSSQDQLGRISNPVCLPPFPLDRDVEIGPVILPPTVYLNKAKYFVGEQIVLSGQTIPNTDVDLSYFIENPSLFSLVKKTYAVAVPRLKVKSDVKGNYSIVLPSSYADSFRIFTQAGFHNQDSARSNTLQVKVLAWWMVIIQFILLLWDLLRSRFFEFFLLLQILALIWYLFRSYLKPHVIARSRALALRDKHPLLYTEHDIVAKE